jgi:hypothetical protein
MDLDDPLQKELSYTDQQVCDKLSRLVGLYSPRSVSFPTNPDLAEGLSRSLLAAVIALKTAKSDNDAMKQAVDVLDKHGESVIDEVRKAWKNGNLESLLDSGMWLSTKCRFVPHSCTVRTYFLSQSQTYRFVRWQSLVFDMFSLLQALLTSSLAVEGTVYVLFIALIFS